MTSLLVKVLVRLAQLVRDRVRIINGRIICILGFGATIGYTVPGFILAYLRLQKEGRGLFCNLTNAIAEL